MIVLCSAFLLAGVLLCVAEEVRGRKLAVPGRVGQHGIRCVDVAVFPLITAVVLLTLVVGLRSWSTGPDSLMYAQQFDVDPSLIRTWLSPGYTLLCILLRSISVNMWPVLFLLMAAATFWFLMMAIWEQSDAPWLSWWIIVGFGFAFETVNQYRQLLAVAIVLYALRYLFEGRTRAFFILAAIATSFHITALLAFAFPYVLRLRISRRCMAASLPVACAVFAVAIPICRPALVMIPYFGNYLGSAHDGGVSLTSLATFAFRYLLFISVLLVARAAARDAAAKRDKDDLLDRYISLIYLGMLLQSIAVTFHLAARFPTYEMCVFAFAIPHVIASIPNSKRRRALTAAVALAFIAMLASLLILRDYSGYAYRAVWQDPIDVQSIPRTTW